MPGFFTRLFGRKNKTADEGPISAKQIELVQSTWAKCVPIAETAANLFYDKLFELDPSLRELFPEEMAEQKKKLMTMIGTAVNGLNNLAAIVPAVEDLGRRHVDYKVKTEHYDTVGQALLWTLGQGLGDAFTDEVKEAWAATYGVLASTMQEAAAKVEAESAAEGDEPPVSAKQIELVQSTWEKVVPIADTAADLFYGKLFEIAPEVRPLFPEDMTEQKKKLFTMIGTAVNGLNNLEAIVPAVQDLGRRHVDYKVKQAHYATVAEALLWTLGQGLGDAFTDEVKEAWTAVYTLLAKVMIDAAEAETASA